MMKSEMEVVKQNFSGSESFGTSFSMNESQLNGMAIEVNGNGVGNGDLVSHQCVNHKKMVLEDVGSKLLSSDFADFRLSSAEKDILPAHRFMLASRSQFFKKMISGTNEYKLDWASTVAIKAALKYIYQGELNLSDFDLTLLIEILQLARQFELPHLVDCIAKYLEESITTNNVWDIYNAGNSLEISALVDRSLSYMDTHAIEVLKEETTLMQESVDNLKMLIQRATFHAPEVEKFKAVYAWINRNPKINQKGIIELISLDRLGQEELLETVRPTKLIDDSVILDAIDFSKRKRSRLSMDTSTNTELYKFDTYSWPFAPKMTIKTVKHETETGCFYYLAEFDEPTEVNFIKMRLSELIGNRGEFSYYIEVSLDKNEWTKVIDYSKIVCRSWQHLYFQNIPTKLIKVVGTKIDGSVNDIIIDSFEAKKIAMGIPELQDGYVVPDEEMANFNNGTRIKYPVNRHDLYLFQSTQAYACFIPVRSFGGDTKKNAFTVQFAQPYMLDSLEFKIYFKDKDSYKFYVEVSLDEHNWDIVEDKRENGDRGLQKIKFDRRPVTFIRIIGTEGCGPGASKFIGCSSFKCPSFD